MKTYLHTIHGALAAAAIALLISGCDVGTAGLEATTTSLVGEGLNQAVLGERSYQPATGETRGGPTVSVNRVELPDPDNRY